MGMGSKTSADASEHLKSPDLNLAQTMQSGPIWILPNSVLRDLAGPRPQTIGLIETWLATRNVWIRTVRPIGQQMLPNFW